MAMLRSYLLDTTYEWLIDHNFTPYLLVDTEYENVEVPWDYVEDDGKIVLNMCPDAIMDYSCNNEYLSFQASFEGEAIQIFVPIEAIMGLYSQETGQGIYARDHGYGLMVNEGENEDDINPTPNKPNTEKDKTTTDKKNKGGLRLV